ncbi:MAG: sigma-54 interaction domain-containing protein, partial [Shewanella sp.]
KQDIHKLAQTAETVLLSGETGTGKSLCAKWLHKLSRRAEGPFVSVNCGALPASLIQSTLFGHEKGAFTGADKRYIGHIEQAEGGTLFLDEIADLPLELQVNLLHFLDNKHIMRIGSNQPIKVDCHLIFATHIDLETAVEEGKFREDLYHRINVLRLHVPCLRDYPCDIMMLAEQLLHCTPEGQNLQFADDAVAFICSYSWPGNVRELQNRVRRAVIMSDGPLIHSDALGIPSHLSTPARPRLSAELNADVLLKAVADNHNNISAAAKQLKISRSTFYRLIKKCNIQR